MKKVLILGLMLAGFSHAQAQDCKAYIPYEEGTLTEQTHYDKKGKATGKTTQIVKEVEQQGNATIFRVEQTSVDKDDENPMVTNMTFRCEDDVFYIDMNTFVNEEQMAAYEDMDIKVTMDAIDIPQNLTPGQQLKDGSIIMDIQSGAPIPIKFTIMAKNRQVGNRETLTTPAGTFDCIKIKQDVVTKTGFTITLQTVQWYAEGVGVVKSETYRKDKLIGYSELTKLEKP
ncbi:MAG: hypothetical protein ACQESW_06855 [Bacteroidota bacterium]